MIIMLYTFESFIYIVIVFVCTHLLNYQSRMEYMAYNLNGERGLVVETCKLGCGAKLPHQELPFHLRDKCKLRTLTCDYCKKSFESRDLCAHGEKCHKMVVSCELKCGVIMCREDMARHLEEECCLVKETCDLGCGMKMTRNELIIHVKDTCAQRLISCNHCFKYFKYCNMSTHLKECPKMRLSCELKCGRLLSRENMTQHLKQDCGLVEEVCKQNCGMKMTRDELKIHVKDTCVQRKLPCKHCFKYFKYCDLFQHVEECPRVIVSCELNCGMKVTRNEQNMHMKNTCTQRSMPCDHCFRYFKYCDLFQHIKVCTRIKLSCELKCGVVMFREDIAQHLEEHCPEKEIACPFAKYNCKVRIKRIKGAPIIECLL